MFDFIKQFYKNYHLQADSPVVSNNADSLLGCFRANVGGTVRVEMLGEHEMQMRGAVRKCTHASERERERESVITGHDTENCTFIQRRV